MIYEKFRDYRPRPEAPDWTSGGRVAKVDRLEWHIIPDRATSVAALQRGEVDWVEAPPSDLQPMLRRHKDIVIDAEIVTRAGERRALTAAEIGFAYRATAVGAEDERFVITDLEHFLDEEITMKSIVIVGNSTSKILDDWFVTPRGYKV